MDPTAALAAFAFVGLVLLCVLVGFAIWLDGLTHEPPAHVDDENRDAEADRETPDREPVGPTDDPDPAPMPPDEATQP